MSVGSGDIRVGSSTDGLTPISVAERSLGADARQWAGLALVAGAAVVADQVTKYVVTSSEFDSVKSRLRNVMFARKAIDNGPGKPTLRTRTEQTDKQKTSPQTTADPSSDDDRPTLKRRTDNP